jgi:hypothetical protein
VQEKDQEPIDYERRPFAFVLIGDWHITYANLYFAVSHDTVFKYLFGQKRRVLLRFFR